MGLEAISQEKIDQLLQIPKKVKNPSAREKQKGVHTEKNYKVVSEDGGISFNLFLRQNTLIKDDFSCGLIWNMPSGETLVLARYNGRSHPHKNHLENEKLTACFHIHKAQEKYLLAGRKAEGYAEETDRYSSLKDALRCLLLDYNISGLSREPDQQGLFDEH